MAFINKIWRDAKLRGVLYQVIIVFLFTLFLAYLFRNTIANLNALGVASGFSFLSQNAGFDIPFSLLDYDLSSGTHGKAFLIGVLNTILVAISGIIAATIIGLTIGVLRLSNNFIISSLAAAYVEFQRNIPLLLHILIWYFAVWVSLPNLMTARELSAFNLFGLDIIYIHNRGINFPIPVFEPGSVMIGVAFMLALIAIYFLRRYARKLRNNKGQKFPIIRASLVCLICLPLLAAVATGFPVSWDVPVVGKFNMKGGVEILGSFFALWAALSLYTGAFIAENVRSGILSVNKGQTEAAIAVGLNRANTLRRVIIPQALRVIIPPVTSHYLSLTKNSSLAVAIGFPDVISISVISTLNIAGQAIEVIFMTMLVYIALSLLISLGMNYYNHKIRITER